MTEPGPASDPVLDPDRLTCHQHTTFSAGSFAAALDRNDAFRVVRKGDSTLAEWTRLDSEDDPSPFGYARVTLAEGVVAVESFSESWLEALVRTLASLAAGPVSGDETRAIRFTELLANPGALLRPEGDPATQAAARLDVAVRFLRGAWPFLPAAELGGRTPATVVATGRGRESVVQLLPDLSEALPARWPGFPHLDPEELTDILFPTVPAPSSGEAPAPTDPRRI